MRKDLIRSWKFSLLISLSTRREGNKRKSRSTTVQLVSQCLRHPNHVLLAGLNNRNVIIIQRFYQAPYQVNRDFFCKLTVYFSCTCFSTYTRELLGCLQGQKRYKKMSLHSLFSRILFVHTCPLLTVCCYLYTSFV